MKNTLPGTKRAKETPEGGFIPSLCYLYQEALRQNLQELAAVIQRAIEQGEHAIHMDGSLSTDSADVLRQFYVLRGFCALNEAQKNLFLREIERIQME